MMNLPSGWQLVKLENLMIITSSKRIFEKEYVNEGIPFYRTKEIKELANALKVSTELFISEERFNEIEAKFGTPQKGDILISAVGTIGEIYVIQNDDKFYFKDGNILWLKEINRNINPQFLKYTLKSFVDKLNLLSSGSAYKALSIEKLKKYKIPLPPLEEQKRIAQILDKADEIRQKRKQAIQLTEELLKSTFLDMFGDPVINPKGWEVKKLEDVTTKITDGTHDTPRRVIKGVLYITGKHIKPFFIDFENCDYLSTKDHEQIYQRCNPQKGDILYTNIGVNLGTAAICNVDFEFSMKNVALLKLKNDYLKSGYIVHLLNNENMKQKIVYISSIGGAQQFLSLKNIKNLIIPIPFIELQNKFSDFVEQTTKLK